MIDRKRAALYISAFLMLVTVAILTQLDFYGCRQKRKGKTFRENYDRLRVGLSKEDIRALWGTPECLVGVGSGKEIWSYRNEGHPIHFVGKITLSDNIKKAKQPTTGQVASLEEMERFSIYSNAELLFDGGGNLEAYTKIGEEVSVHTKYGDITGSGWSVYERFLNEMNRRRGEGLHRGSEPE